MPLKVSERGQMAPFMVMDVLYAANQRASLGNAVYHLEIGQPGTGAPREVIEAIHRLATIYLLPLDVGEGAISHNAHVLRPRET